MVYTVANEDVEEYMDTNTFIYNLFAKNSLHYGFWDENTSDANDAHQNTNKYMAKYLELKSDDIVLDAGCGVGGTSIYYAKEIGSSCIGVTLSSRQIEIAKENAKSEGVQNLLDFKQMNFKKLSFEDYYFSKISAMESLSHEPERNIFIDEAFRVLKYGGRLAIMDAFLLKKESERTSKEDMYYYNLLSGWCLPDFNTPNEIIKMCEEVGFKNVKFESQVPFIYKSAEGISSAGWWSYPITYPLMKLKIIPKSIHDQAVACVAQKQLIDKKVCTYGVIIADKL